MSHAYSSAQLLRQKFASALTVSTSGKMLQARKDFLCGAMLQNNSVRHNKIWQCEFQLLNPSAPHLTVWIFFLGSYDLKYVCRRTLCACINKWKFKEITSFPEINEAIYTERHFIAEDKTHHKTHLHTTKVYNTWPSQFCSLKSKFFFYHSAVFTCSKVINALKQ